MATQDLEMVAQKAAGKGQAAVKEVKEAAAEAAARVRYWLQLLSISLSSRS